tara:strand:- start:367 stop:2247 length:1881 start_codon:yes stop_codon:yes gene_type:complete
MDKDRLLNIQFTNEVLPKTIESPVNEWIGYGDGDYKNLYPNYIIDLYNNSATHAAVVNATAAMIAGENLLIEEGNDLQQYVALKKFLADAGENTTLHEIVTKIAFDLKLQGAFALNIIWSKDRSRISQIKHIPVEKLRVGKPNEDGKVTEYYLSSDWAQYRRKEHTPIRIAAFNEDDRSEASQIMYKGLYSPAMELYFTPDYISANNWIQIDNLTADYHLNNISNGFSASYFINFASGIPTAEERRQIEHQITQKFSGSNNSGKMILTFSDDANSKPEIVPIQVSNADKQYTVLNELCIQNIMIGHRVTSPMLLGVKTEGQLGGRGELLQAHELYTNTVVRPFQEVILKCIRKILSVNDIAIPISIEMAKPLNSIFDADTLKEVLTQDEIRAELGYAPLEKQEETVAEQVAMCNHEIEASDVLEPSEENLIKYIDEIYEVEEDLIAEGYELVDEEDVDEDEGNYDFAANTAAIKPTGVGSKSRRADGKFFKIRYVYRPLTVVEGSREFCRHMVTTHADSIFRREDISKMSSQKANGDFGFYDIFKFKGRFNCRHTWRRRTYVLRNAKSRVVIDGTVYERGDRLPNLEENYKSVTTAAADGVRIPVKDADENIATKKNKQVGKGYQE